MTERYPDQSGWTEQEIVEFDSSIDSEAYFDAPVVEIGWIVETDGDDECGALEVNEAVLADAQLLRELILEDFDERGGSFDDWASGPVVAVRAEIPGRGRVDL